MTLNVTRQGRQSDNIAELTKQTILEAALSVFAEHGFEGASLRLISRRAGITHGLIRHHFGSKDAIFRAVVDVGVTRYTDAYAPVLKAIAAGDIERDPVRVVKLAIHTFAHVSANYPDMPRLLMHEGSSRNPRLGYITERITELSALFDPLFDALQALGLLKGFTMESYLLFLICNLCLPFGLSEISNHYIGGDILEEAQVKAQAERMINLLLPAQTPEGA